MSEFIDGPGSQGSDTEPAVRGPRPDQAELVQLEIALVRWVRGDLDTLGGAAGEANQATHDPKAGGRVAATAGAVTFVCTLVIAVGTVLLCYVTIK
jgi:hypothetical protein